MSEKQMPLISGPSGSGKSVSLMNIRNQEKWLYLNCEAGKRLPFKNNFQSKTVIDPYQVPEAFTYINDNPGKFEGIAIDTCTFLMDMFESIYIVGSPNTQAAWGAYAQYWKNLMQDKVANCKVPVVILGHTRSELNEQAMEMQTSVPVKGSLKNQGLEAYFSTVVSTKKVQMTELGKFENDLLHITDEEKELGFKHVFQTRITKQTTGERIRSPMGLFSIKETYIDNDAQLLLDHLDKFYA